MKQPATDIRKPRFKFRSIQTKLTLAIVLILIPVTALLSILSFRNAQTLLKDRVFEQLETIITDKQDRINEVVTDSLERAERITSEKELLTAVQQADNQPNETNLNRLSTLLEEKLPLYPEFTNLYLVSQEGSISASAKEFVETDIDIQLMNAMGEKDKSTFFEDEGKYYAASPVTLQEKNLENLILEIDNDTIPKILRTYSGLGRTGEIVLGKRDAEDIVYLNKLRNQQDSNSQFRSKINENPRLPIVLAVQNLSGSTITQDYRDIEVVASYRHLPAMGWGLVVKIDTAEAFTPIQTLKTELIQVSFLTLLLFLLVAFVVSRSITDPLQRLHVGTEKIGKGQWDLDLDIHTGDEVEQLANEFSNMAHQLKSLYTGLEKKVEERTLELQGAKDEIEKEKIKAETILTSIGDGVFVSDASGKIVFFNRAAEQFSGYSRKEALGKEFFEIVEICKGENKPLPKEEALTMLALREGKTTRTDKLFYTHKDGRVYPVVLVATPLIIEGKIIGAIIVFRDITHEKEVDRMKTEFISVASHQLRTPLSAIKWFTEMLLAEDAGRLTAEQKKFLEQVYGSNERMIELVNALLNVSRIEQGRIAIDPEPTDLLGLINEVLAELEPKINQKGLKVILSKHEKLPKISIDPKLIRQVYANLITNAVKYTPDRGEITILISRKGNDVLTQIQDSGYGIPEDQQKRVFTKFFRADNILRISAEGTGLGLHIVKSVVESSGGKIWFQSEEGKGTTFWFTLPMKGTPHRKGERTLEEVRL